MVVLDGYLVYTFIQYYYTQRDGKHQINVVYIMISVFLSNVHIVITCDTDMYLYVYYLSCNMVLAYFVFLMCFFIYCQNRSRMTAATSDHLLFVTGWSVDWHTVWETFQGHWDKQLKQGAVLYIHHTWTPWKHC
jgi:hypothetical protein